MAKLKGRAPRVRVAAGDVRAAMRVRFAPPAFAMFEEVGNATGFACGRHADAVVVSLWPSRGLWIHGFEIKVSRQDWQKELATPAKADAIAKHCDYWSLVTGDESIVQPGELPETWGHLTLRGDKLFVLKEATKNVGSEPSRGFVAALLRRAHETIDARVSDAYRRGKTDGASDTNPDLLASLRRANEKLTAEIEAFERASGIKIELYRGAHLGEAVAKLTRLRNIFGADPALQCERGAEFLERQAETLRGEARTLREQRAIADSVETPRAPVQEASA